MAMQIKLFVVVVVVVVVVGGGAMVSILARPSRAKIPITKPRDFGVPLKRTSKIRLDIYRTQIRPSELDIVAISGH